VVTDRQACHVAAHLLDNAGAFMPEHDGQLLGCGCRDDPEVGVADAGTREADDNFVRSGAFDVDLDQFQWGGCGAQHRGVGFHDTAPGTLLRVMVWWLVYSASPCREFSAPWPDCLWPPKT
jgi:hypothetical protein